MSEKRQVMVCGKSIYMTGMVMNLRRDRGFEVIATAQPAGIAALLRQGRPAAVIFDSREFEQDRIAAYIKDYHPDLPLIALNPEDNTAVVYSCRRRPAQTLHDLNGIIMESAGLNEPRSEKGD